MKGIGMKKISILTVVLIGVLFMSTGCSTVSMNVKKATARSAGDMIATVILDMKNDNILTSDKPVI